LNSFSSNAIQPELNKTKVESTPLPEKYELLGNFPNPFNPVTSIKYSIPRLSKVAISIYNILGEKVFEIKNLNQNAGIHSTVWNGKNEKGTSVSSEMYIYKFEATALEGKKEKYSKSAKMLLIK